jgi:SAM-dependent methyltransferase
MYDARLTDVYDAIYRARGKDYPAEAAQVAELARQRHPAATSLLDVACGTGAHLAAFADVFDHVEGLEFSADMIEAARRRLPAVPLHAGDMRDFDLGRTFDVVTCMFSSIAYMADDAELTAALTRMAAHLVPGGVVVIEPWWFPETFLPGYVAGDAATVDGRTIARVSHTVRDGGVSRMSAHYLVAEADSGVRHFVVEHINTLFSRERYELAFKSAGLGVEYLPGGPSGRGLFVAVRD